MDCTTGNNQFGSGGTGVAAPNSNGTDDFCTWDSVNERLTCDASQVCGSASSDVNDMYMVELDSGLGWAAMVICDVAGSTAVDYCGVYVDGTPAATEVQLVGTDAHDFMSFTFGTRAMGQVSASLTARMGGKAGNDTLVGRNNSSYDEVLDGNGGNDHIRGDAGADTIDGGDGHDFIDAGSGVDAATGGAGDDWVIGGSSTGGHDTLYGQGGDDLICGKDATNGVLANIFTSYASGSRPSYTGGLTSDWHTWSGTAGAPTCSTGGSHDDWIEAGAGDDVVYAGGSTDENRVDGGTGSDELYGGANDDWLCDPGNEGDEVWSMGSNNGDDRIRITTTGVSGPFATIDGGDPTESKCSDNNRPSYMLTITHCTQVADYTCPF